MPGAVLHIIGGNDRGKQHELNKATTSIGRGTDQDVVLADIAVSRRHVTILMEGGRFRLKDLGSGNGSLVNGQRMDSVVLNDGDQIEIGNTLMRFDHPASRPQAAAPPAMAGGPPPAYPPPSYSGSYPPGYPPPGAPPGYPPPGYPPPAYGAPPPGYPPPGPHGYPPPGYPPPGYPPSGYPAPGYPPPGYGSAPGSMPPVEPSYGAGVPIGAASGYVGPPTGMRDRVGPLATPMRKLAVFGGMGLVSVLGLIAIVSRTVMAQPVVASNEAEDTYRQGLRLFAAGDYELAKAKFNEVAAQAVDAPEPRRYARLCDAELQARTSLKNAERALVNRRYTEAVRALDAVENTSVYYDQASRQRRDAAPKAAAEMIDEARRLAQDNPDEARNRLKAALELDPNNPDGRDLLGRLHVGGALPPSTLAAPAPAPAPSAPANPPPSPATVAAASKEPSHESSHRSHASKEPKEPKEPKELPDDSSSKASKQAAAGPAMAQPDSKAAQAAYKARDFAGAVKAYMNDSMRQPEKQAKKTIEYANQVRSLAQLVERAGADEAKAPAQAVKEYEQAIALDQRLAKGMHTAYFKQRIGGLGVQAAKDAFAKGNYELAYQAALAVQKSGGDAGAVMKQLEQKASELVSQGVAAQKTNVGQAKQLWRSVLKMVPASSPNYTKAYSLLNAASPQRRDEDED